MYLTATIRDAEGQVVGMLRQRDLNPIAVVITGGDAATVDEASGTIRVPKRDLVGAVLIAL